MLTPRTSINELFALLYALPGTAVVLEIDITRIMQRHPPLPQPDQNPSPSNATHLYRIFGCGNNRHRSYPLHLIGLSISTLSPSLPHIPLRSGPGHRNATLPR